MMHFCGTPRAKCNGSLVTVNAAWQPDGDNKKSGKLHNTAQNAFKCYSAYLVSQGYKRVGSREFESPESGAVLVLDKKSKFGAKFRKGKMGDKTGSRFVPKRGRGAVR